MNHIVVLTKSYRLEDFYWWFTYHKKLGFTIHVIDNESQCNVKDIVKIDGTPEDTYETITGWPNQWQLFDDILNGNRYNFKDGDYVAFIDDDEYLWFYIDYWKKWDAFTKNAKTKTYDFPSLEKFLDNINTSRNDIDTGTILMPQILMSTPIVTDSRFKPVTEHALYRREDESSQGKVIIRYNSKNNYKFNHGGDENGHVPFVNGTRQSIVNGVGVSNSTYGQMDPTACLRLYHYHIKSRLDWTMKWNRGSAAVDHQWYNAAIENNKNFGGYVIPDFTMLETWRLFGLC